MDSPRAIVLFPKKGLMFWTDWGSKPKIECAYLNGHGRMTLVNNTIMKEVYKKAESIKWPNGLAIDYENELIYWVDAGIDYLVQMDLFGSKYCCSKG